MKLIIGKDEYWIKDNAMLPPSFNQMNNYERWSYIVKNKLFHREDGPAHINSFGTKCWYLNGLSHREDGPAIIWADGTEWWYLNGRCHRIDGPAKIWLNGYKEWYLNGIRVNRETYKKVQNSPKEELLVYMINPEYKDYLPLIEYRLNQ